MNSPVPSRALWLPVLCGADPAMYLQELTVQARAPHPGPEPLAPSVRSTCVFRVTPSFCFSKAFKRGSGPYWPGCKEVKAGKIFRRFCVDGLVLPAGLAWCLCVSSLHMPMCGDRTTRVAKPAGVTPALLQTASCVRSTLKLPAK